MKILPYQKIILFQKKNIHIIKLTLLREILKIYLKMK